jgi:HSP20 family protein
MFFRFDELDRSFGWADQLHRQLDRWLGQVGVADIPRAEHGGAFDWRETESDIWLRADLPGVVPDSVVLEVQGRAMTLSAKRALTPPEGYRAHLNERRGFEFTRSVKLPASVDTDKVKASFDNGVLTVRLGKHAPQQPRQITVKH